MYKSCSHVKLKKKAVAIIQIEKLKNLQITSAC
jgi:hypothetical protein